MGVSCSPPKELAGVHSLVGARGSFFKETLAKILFCRAKFNAPEQFHGQIGCFERGIQSHRGQTRGLERFRDGTRNFGGGASSPGAWKTSPNGKIAVKPPPCGLPDIPRRRELPHHSVACWGRFLDRPTYIFLFFFLNFLFFQFLIQKTRKHDDDH